MDKAVLDHVELHDYLKIDIGILLPFSPFAEALKMLSLPLCYFPWLFAILFAYSLLTQVVKNWFIKKFNSWL